MDTWEWAEVKRQMELTGIGPRTEIPEVTQTPRKVREREKLREELDAEIEAELREYFVDYDDLDKGVVSGTSTMLLLLRVADDLGPTTPGSPCSLDLLTAMDENIRRVSLMQLGIAITWTDSESEDTDDESELEMEQEDLDLLIHVELHATQTELKRLLQHPELFPDGTSRWFLEAMEIRLRDVLHDWHLLDASEQSEQLEWPEDLKEYRERILPDYDESRTMWQQFLHHSAPGSGTPQGRMNQHGCTQMVTASGSLILMNRRDEHNDFARFLEEVCARIHPRSSKPALRMLAYSGPQYRQGRNYSHRGRLVVFAPWMIEGSCSQHSTGCRCWPSRT